MQNVTNVPPQLFKQLFTRKALLILFLVWTAVILFQTWGIQQSCNPMFAWQNTENNILKCSSIRKITVNPQKLDLKEGETHLITATVNGTGSFSSDVTWSSSSPKIATVDNRGLVTAVAEGKATITTISNQDNGKQDTSSITISKPYPTITSVKVSPHQFNLKVDETSNLTVTVSGSGSFSSNVTWSSSNLEIATVDRNGLVTAVSKGKATITATSNQDNSKRDFSIATISNLPPVIYTVTVNPKEFTLIAGENRNLTATVSGTGPFNSDVTWSSSNTQVATVNSQGLVTALAQGQATITATSNQDSSKQDISSATIFPPEITNVTVDPKPVPLKVGKPGKQLTATVKGKGSFSKDVTWSSSDNGIATVDSNGFITAKSKGSATITAMSNQDISKKDTVNVTTLEGGDNPIPVPPITIITGTAVTVGAVVVGVNAAPAFVAGTAAALLIQWLSSK